MNVLKNKKIGSEKLNVLTFIQIIFFFLFPGKKKNNRNDLLLEYVNSPWYPGRQFHC